MTYLYIDEFNVIEQSTTAPDDDDRAAVVDGVLAVIRMNPDGKYQELINDHDEWVDIDPRNGGEY